MNTIGGWGGVKLSITIVETLTVLFPATKAHCSLPEYEPVGWKVETENGKTLQKNAGLRGHFTVLFENIEDGDELLFKSLNDIIDASQRENIPILLYPRWNDSSLSNLSYLVRCSEAWEIGDINDKISVGQRIKDLKLHTTGLITGVIT